MRNRSIGDHNEELWTLIWMYNQNYANYQEISTIFSKNVPKQCMHTCDFFWIWKWTYFGFIHSVHCKSIPEKYNFSTIVLGNEWGGVQMTIKEYFWLQNLFYKRGGGGLNDPPKISCFAKAFHWTLVPTSNPVLEKLDFNPFNLKSGFVLWYLFLFRF